MKILLSAFACEPNRGSEPGVGWNWAVELAKYHEVWVLTRSNNREKIESVEAIKNLHFIYYSVPGLKFLENYSKNLIIHFYYTLWQRKIIKVIVKKNEKYNFDIAHHVTYNEFRNLPQIWKIRNIKTVVGPLGGGQTIEKALIPYCEGNINRLKESIRGYINILSKQKILRNNLLSKYDLVFIADDSTYNFLECKSINAISMLETGIKSENLEDGSSLHENKNKKFQILWAGLLIYRKGFSLLIDAIEKLEDKEGIEVIVIGNGPLKSVYKQRIKERNLERYFNFKGELPYEQMKKCYLSSDLFVFTSLRDTSGNVVLEAMSNGLPTIALRHHGVKNMLDDNAGILIDVNSTSQVVSDLAVSISKLRNNPTERLIMGKHAIKLIKENFLWEEKAKKMSHYYNEIYK